MQQVLDELVALQTQTSQTCLKPTECRMNSLATRCERIAPSRASLSRKNKTFDVIRQFFARAKPKLMVLHWCQSCSVPDISWNNRLFNGGSLRTDQNTSLSAHFLRKKDTISTIASSLHAGLRERCAFLMAGPASRSLACWVAALRVFSTTFLEAFKKNCFRCLHRC